MVVAPHAATLSHADWGAAGLVAFHADRKAPGERFIRRGPNGLAHGAAAFGAGAAGLHAGLHATDVLAAFGAPLTNHGAEGAKLRVQLALAQHEIRTGLADLGAVEHQAQMGRLDVFAADLQAMGGGHLQANGVASLAAFDARLEFRGGVGHKPPWVRGKLQRGSPLGARAVFRKRPAGVRSALLPEKTPAFPRFGFGQRPIWGAEPSAKRGCGLGRVARFSGPILC
jgi:hypothetical protein